MKIPVALLPRAPRMIAQIVPRSTPIWRSSSEATMPRDSQISVTRLPNASPIATDSSSGMLPPGFRTLGFAIARSVVT
jgi:hypothetical protein